VASIVNRIRAWSTELHYWERAALEKLANGTLLTPKDYNELLLEYMADYGLGPMPAERPTLSFSGPAEPTVEKRKVQLVRLFNLANVNALPPGQEIHFGSQLTLIYGNNGAGKSGYARPLGCAAFSRGEREVLPNATKDITRATPKAEIEVSDGDSKTIVEWTKGITCPQLSGFHVFDAGSLQAHLTGTNSIKFAPAGLSLLTRLAELTDEIRNRILLLAEEKEAPHNFQTWFEGNSRVTEAIQSIGPATKVDDLKNLAQMSEEEAGLIPQLEQEIHELKASKIQAYAGKRRQEIADLQKLTEAISTADQSLSDQQGEKVKQLISNLQARRTDAQKLSVDQFKSDNFKMTGTDVWRRFIIAAKALADGESVAGAAYPRRGDHCLLCRQPLGQDAITLITHLWQFLASDAQARLETSRRERDNKALEIEKINLDYFQTDSGGRRLLESDSPLTVPTIQTQIQACSERKNELIASLREERAPSLAPAILADTVAIEQLIQTRKAELEELNQRDPDALIKQREETLRDLKHRRTLSQKVDEIEKYLARIKWAARARASIGTTRHITMKYNELFKELVTDEYVKLFQKTLKRFKSKLLVTVDTRGKKGETVRQITLSPNSFPTRFPVEKVLSEGEKTAVAIADFLTEAVLDQSTGGIVLDDPITSLDDTWKETLAQCLAEQAKFRQVVIFTHDLGFLYHLTEQAEKLKLAVTNEWIREENDTPGFVYLDNSPVCESTYKSADAATKCYTKAKDMKPQDQQQWLQQGFGALRTSYEALAMFELFGGVVERFKERIGFDKLGKVRIDPKTVDKIVEGMGRLSRHIDAHLHSDKFASVKPTPETLLTEIQEFEEIRKSVKEYKKTTA
jgi:ABC-type uncharacterized transport system ATPase subunit